MPETPVPAGAADADTALRIVEPGIAVLTLQRPQRLNALTDATVAEIGRRLDAVHADLSLRVLILTGAGRGFCAGFDLGEAASAPGQDVHGEAAAWTMRQEAFASLVARLRGL